MLVGLIGIVPLIYAVWEAFTNQGVSALHHNFVGFSNFMAAVFRPSFLDSLVVTGIFVVVCTVVEFVIGYGIAYFLNLQLRGYQLARSVLLIPMLLTPVVIGLVFKFMFTPKIGVVYALLQSVGVHIPWFTDAFWGKVFIVTLDSWLFVPFVMLMLLAGMSGVSKEQLEAASLDGAGWWKKTRYVSLPALAPVIMITLLLRVVDTSRMFDQVYSSTRGGPGTSTLTTSILVYNDTFGSFQFGYGAAEAVTLTLLLSPFYFLYIRLTRI
ncbi:ABC transporter permease [Frondihabitans sucicola]|uniref:ABC transporter permease n=1 Tax=Frondihabitans sucicola TaxID=1268041 RepID=A0ABM8GKE9_9MICO|nr:sugar ABC transporter permease [Frondihabitans sucicola]BDZ48862.1 ABC transporter permease [Frondihabitans sucicola]